MPNLSTADAIKLGATSVAAAYVGSTLVWPTGFDPLSIAGLEFWLDASDASAFTFASGTIVSQWNDKSGNARHVSQATGSLQPTRDTTQNSLYAVRFAGNDILSGSAVSTTTAHTTFIVFRDTGATFTSGHLGQYGRSRYDRAYNATGDLGYTRVGVANEVFGSAAATVGQGYNAWTWTHSASNSTLYKNGTSVYSGSSGNDDLTATAISIGGANSTFFLGVICEWLHYSATLGSTDRSAVESYLRTKWGTA